MSDPGAPVEGPGGPPRPDDGIPAGTRLALTPDTRRPGPGLLTGGAPWRLVRLTEAGNRWVDRWAAGARVPASPGTRHLARRLVLGGLASARPEPDPGRPVTVVVPARNRARGLAATLASLDGATAVVVVDDASTDGGATAAVAAGRPGTELVTRRRQGGPGAARNTGWRHRVSTTGGLVAFLDTECVPPTGWLGALAGHFSDPAVGAVAPRITPVPAGRGHPWLDAYELARSPLDLGPLPATVRPRSRVPYVPSAALVVRDAALASVDGFDESLPTGEDVDLVWRLAHAGWEVRYDPSVVVSHPVRDGPGGWLRQRHGYGRSAAPLAARHGCAVAPLVVPWTSAASWALAAAGRPVAGLAVAAAAAARFARNPATAALPRAEVARLAVRSHLLAARGLADATRRTWWPLAAVAAVVSRRARRAVAAIVVVPPVVEWLRHRPALGVLPWTALRLADDIAYGTGVWAGVVRSRRATCLMPVLT